MTVPASSKIVLITGANQGLGFEIAKSLSKLDYHVLMGSRDVQRGIAAAKRLQGEGLSVEPITIEYVVLNFTSHIFKFCAPMMSSHNIPILPQDCVYTPFEIQDFHTNVSAFSLYCTNIHHLVSLPTSLLQQPHSRSRPNLAALMS